MFKAFRLIRRVGVRDLFRGVRQLPAYARLIPRLLMDRRTPISAKMLLVAAAVYVVSPLDFVPDFLPVLGEMDDLAILLFAGSRFLSMIPPHVRHEHEVACGLAEPARVTVTN